MDDALAKRGHSLEDAFFAERNAQLLAQLKKLEEMKKTKEVLAEVSGIRNPKVLDKLIELDVSPSILTSLILLPLIEVAWADGHLTNEEKQSVLDEASKNGLSKGSINYEIFETWLKEKPSPKLFDAWVHYIKGLCETMDHKELNDLKIELFNRANKVANASGGILGIAKTSSEEKAVLDRMEEAFKR